MIQIIINSFRSNLRVPTKYVEYSENFIHHVCKCINKIK